MQEILADLVGRQGFSRDNIVLATQQELVELKEEYLQRSTPDAPVPENVLYINALLEGI